MVESSTQSRSWNGKKDGRVGTITYLDISCLSNLSLSVQGQLCSNGRNSETYIGFHCAYTLVDDAVNRQADHESEGHEVWGKQPTSSAHDDVFGEVKCN